MRVPSDQTVIALLFAASLLLAARVWLFEHPQHDPWAPLRLADPPGWATGRKVAALRTDVATCRGFLARSGIAAEALPATGEGACRRADRQVLVAPGGADVALRPRAAQATCAVDAGLALWLRHEVQPAARAAFGSEVATIEHVGTNNCRRIGGGAVGSWSEHATGNAIDIAGFRLPDGRRISVLRDWAGTSEASVFLRAVRDGACRSFATVLSPDYNAAHADHLHLDQAARASGWTTCR